MASPMNIVELIRRQDIAAVAEANRLRDRVLPAAERALTRAFRRHGLGSVEWEIACGTAIHLERRLHTNLSIIASATAPWFEVCQ